MEYSINKTKRNIIILSSSILILYVFTIRLFYFFKGPVKIDTVQIVIQHIIFLISYGYIIMAIFDYFRHYKFKVLQISILIILIMEVFFRAFSIARLFVPTWKLTMLFIPIMIWIISNIILSVFLFRIKKKDYPGILSIRNYAISSFVLLNLAQLLLFFMKPAGIFATQQLVELTSAIPYIFSIDFAIKLYLKE